MRALRRRGSRSAPPNAARTTSIRLSMPRRPGKPRASISIAGRCRTRCWIAVAARPQSAPTLSCRRRHGPVRRRRRSRATRRHRRCRRAFWAGRSCWCSTSRQAQSAAAIVRGFAAHDPRDIAGVILNRVASARHRAVAPMPSRRSVFRSSARCRATRRSTCRSAISVSSRPASIPI